MRNFSLLVLFVLSIFGFTKTQAQNVEFNGTDITELVSHLKNSIVVLKQPITVYNWSPAGKYGDAENLGIAESGSKTFWNSFGYDPSGNMYGRGLYAAVDPIVSSSYGGYNDDWLLLEMKLPVGFILLDLLNFEITSKPFPEGAKKNLVSFNCPENSTIESLFVEGGNKLSGYCQKLVKYIYADIFKIDGFAYGYSESAFKACQKGGFYSGARAFVITDKKWIKPGLITYYNSNSTHEIEKRIVIQSLFYSLLENNSDLKKQVLSAIGGYLTNHQDSDISKFKSKCEGETCTITVTFCEKEKCEDIDLPTLPRPEGSVISEKTALKIPIKVSHSRALLWSDLEGKTKANNLTEWLQSNKFGCSGKLPY